MKQKNMQSKRESKPQD